MTVRAIILAAGRGSRMGDLTHAHPKCLVPLAGKALLEWQMEALRAAGVGEVAMVTGYLAKTLQGCGDTTFHNPRWAETNMVASLRCASPWLEATPCVVSYADILYHPESVKALLDAEGEISLTYDLRWEELWSLRFADPLSDAETFRVDANGRLQEIGQRPRSKAEVQGQYMGLLKFNPAGWAKVRSFLRGLPPTEADRLDMTGLLVRLLDIGIDIQAIPVAGRWCEVDSDTDLRLYGSKTDSVEPWAHDWRWPGVG